MWVLHLFSNYQSPWNWGRFRYSRGSISSMRSKGWKFLSNIRPICLGFGVDSSKRNEILSSLQHHVSVSNFLHPKKKTSNFLNVFFKWLSFLNLLLFKYFKLYPSIFLTTFFSFIWSNWILFAKAYCCYSIAFNFFRH